jgi:hypothetical protein
LPLTSIPLLLDVSDRYNNLKTAWESLVDANNHGHPHAFQVAVTVVLEQLKREQTKKKQRLNHTFASSSAPSASHLLEVLITRVVGCKPARSSCNVVFVLKAMHLGIGHIFCLRILF